MMFVGLFALFVLLQVPATWLLGKFYPNMRYIHNVSGNIWQGEADWAYQDLQGTMTWSTRPWEILRLRASSNITLNSGETQTESELLNSDNFEIEEVLEDSSPNTESE